MLYLILTNREEAIEGVETALILGESDHVILEFHITQTLGRKKQSNQRLILQKS